MAQKVSIEYRLFFQRRSGGHAIVEWIPLHFEEPGVLINSLRPHVKWTRPTKYWNIEYPFHNADDETQLRQYEKGRLKIVHPFVVTTYEDALRYADGLYRFKKYGITTSKIKYIIIIRDVYNHVVSRLKFSDKRKTPAPPGWYSECIIHWKQLAINKNFDFCFRLNYNDWFTKKKYRIQLGEMLELPNNDGRFDYKIHSYGGGSSFTGTRKDANPKEILGRYKEYIEEFGITPKFKKVLDDDELRKINLSIFGWALNKKGRLISK